MFARHGAQLCSSSRSRQTVCIEARSGSSTSSSASSSVATLQRRRASASGFSGKTAFAGARVAAPTNARNGAKARMAQWLDNRAEVEVPVPLEVCWALWDDRERIPQWMPWIKSVKVLADTDPALSRWTLATRQFGRDWEFSWLARNLAPVRNQKIHWRSEAGAGGLADALSINNRGQVRFARRGPGACSVSLSISYEVPDVLAPFASALTPLVEGIIGRDMERFREYAAEYARAAAAAAAAAPAPPAGGGGSGSAAA